MHSTECNDNALVKMHYNAGKNIECNTCRIRRIMHNASIVRTRSKCKIARMFKNVIENSRMIYNALRIIGAKITRLWGKNHTPPDKEVVRLSLSVTSLIPDTALLLVKMVRGNECSNTKIFVVAIRALPLVRRSLLIF